MRICLVDFASFILGVQNMEKPYVRIVLIIWFWYTKKKATDHEWDLLRKIYVFCVHINSF